MNIKTKYDEKIKGNFSAFDRMILKGHISPFFQKGNMGYYLWKEQVLLPQFGDYAEGITQEIKQNAKKIAESKKRPYVYLNNSRISKEKYARQIMQKDSIDEGLICILRAYFSRAKVLSGIY